MESLVDLDTDSVYIFPSTSEFLYDTDLIGNGFEREMVLDAVRSKFI